MTQRYTQFRTVSIENNVVNAIGYELECLN